MGWEPCDNVRLRQQGSEAARQRGSEAARQRGSEAAGLRGCEAARLRGCGAAWLRGCEAARRTSLLCFGYHRRSSDIWLVGKRFAAASMEPNGAFNAIMSLMLTFFTGIVALSLTLFVCRAILMEAGQCPWTAASFAMTINGKKCLLLPLLGFFSGVSASVRSSLGPSSRKWRT